MKPQASISGIAASIVLLAIGATADADTRQGPTADQLAAYERGRSYQRIVFVLQDPSVCFIAALRPRVETDLKSIEGEPETSSAVTTKTPSPFSTLEQFLRTGNADDISADIVGANYFEPFLTKGAPHNPTRWWFVEAGMAETELRGSTGNLLWETMAGIHADWLANHLRDSGQFSTLVPLSDLNGKKLPQLQSAASIASDLSASPEPEPSTADFDEIQKYQTDLVHNLDDAFPEGAYPAITYPSGLLGDARLGVAWFTIGELAEEPRFLWQPETQAFIDTFFRRLRLTLNDSKADQVLADARSILSAGSTPRENDVVEHIGTGIARLLYSHLPSARTDVIFLGADATQAVWQGAVKSVSEAKFDRDWVASHASLDSLVPGLDKLRQVLGDVKPDDWADLVDKAQVIVTAITSGQHS